MTTKIIKQSDMQSRWRSPVAWAAVFGVIAFIFGNYGIYSMIGMTSETFKIFINVLFAALTAFGIFNDPTNKTGF